MNPEIIFNHLLTNLTPQSWNGSNGLGLGKGQHDLTGHLYLAADGLNRDICKMSEVTVLPGITRYNNAYRFNLPGQRTVAHYLSYAIRPNKRLQWPINALRNSTVILEILRNFSHNTPEIHAVKGVVEEAQTIYRQGAASGPTHGTAHAA